MTGRIGPLGQPGNIARTNKPINFGRELSALVDLGRGCWRPIATRKFGELFEALDHLAANQVLKCADPQRFESLTAELLEGFCHEILNEVERQKQEKVLLKVGDQLVKLLSPNNQPRLEVAPDSRELRIRENVLKKGQAPDLEELMTTLQWLKTKKKLRTELLEQRLLHRDSLQVSGAVGELMVAARLRHHPELEIVDLGDDFKRSLGGGEMQLFDLVCRQKHGDKKLILMEIKRVHENHFTLGDFVYQFFGIGSESLYHQVKEHCQLDLLLAPAAYLGARKPYLTEIERGDYEIQVITAYRFQTKEFGDLYRLSGKSDNNLGVLEFLDSVAAGLLNVPPPQPKVLTWPEKTLRDVCRGIGQKLQKQMIPFDKILLKFIPLTDL